MPGRRTDVFRSLTLTPPLHLSQWIGRRRTERDADLRTRQQFAVTVLCAAHELMLPSLQAVTEGVLTDLGT